MNKNSINYLLIFFSAILLFVPFLGYVHLFDWDEINFAEISREMIVTNNFLDVQINFIPFWEKPPFFFWLQVLSMKIFGINEFAARFPNAVCGIISLIFIFKIGNKIVNQQFAWLWVMAYSCSILPFVYFKSGIIDPWLNLFIFISIYYSIEYYFKKKTIYIFWIGLFIGLGVLTKGPIAMFIFGMSALIFLITVRFKLKTSIFDILVFIIMVLISTGIWFLFQYLKGNGDVIIAFVKYQIELLSMPVAGHKGFMFYHVVVLFFGVFPASVFAISGFSKSINNTQIEKYFKRIMLIVLLVVLIFFSLARTKIIHYSSMCYFPISFFAAYALYHIINGKLEFKKYLKVILISITILFSLLSLVIALIHKIFYFITINNIITDKKILADFIPLVNVFGFEWLISVLFLMGMIFFVFYIKKQKVQLVGVFISTLLFSYLSLLFFVPIIEGYSQRSAIEFYEQKSSEDVYYKTGYFKSYAPYFYGKIKKTNNKNLLNHHWLMDSKTDKKVYFICKSKDKAKANSQYPDLKFLYEKNGYVFAHRADTSILVE